MTQLAIFDLDGTLVDSRRDLATAINALVRELGAPPFSEEVVGNMVGEGASVLVRRALAAAGLPEDTPGALDRFLALYDEHLLDTTMPYEGIEPLLQTLSERMRLAVLTNKPQAATDRVLSGLALDRFFAAVIGGDTAHGRKPDPAGLLHILTTLGVVQDGAVLIGDSPIDGETARRAGVRMYFAGYGFGYRPAPLAAHERHAGSPLDLANLF